MSIAPRKQGIYDNYRSSLSWICTGCTTITEALKKTFDKLLKLDSNSIDAQTGIYLLI